jgi:hypothetical protein
MAGALHRLKRIDEAPLFRVRDLSDSNIRLRLAPE